MNVDYGTSGESHVDLKEASCASAKDASCVLQSGKAKQIIGTYLAFGSHGLKTNSGLDGLEVRTRSQP